MTTFMEPTIDISIDLVGEGEKLACVAGYVWCNGDCNEPNDEDEAWENENYHFGTVAFLSMLRFTPNGWKDLDDITLVVRHDAMEGDESQPLIQIDYPWRECKPGMTARQARQNAAWLMTAADMLDPLPTGVMARTAVDVRIGDELLTDDGWQKVNGLLFDADIEQASIFTPERPMGDGYDGWDLSFNDPVKLRRPLHGSCAIQFIEPIPASSTGGTK